MNIRRRPFLVLFGADPALDHLHPYETSWLLPPLLLGLWRAIIATYLFFVIIYLFAYYAAEGDNYLIGMSFSYFTNLNLWGMAFYFLVSAIHTLAYAVTGRSVIFDKLPRVFRGLHALYYTANTTFPFLVLIIYWGVLYSGPWFTHWFGAWSNVSSLSFLPDKDRKLKYVGQISEHGLIGLWSLLEIILTTTPTHPLINLAFLILILALYLCLAYVTNYTQGWYPYTFLNPEGGKHSGKVAAYCFIILAAIIIIFGISWFFIWLRRRLTGGKIKRARCDRTLVYDNQNNNYNNNNQLEMSMEPGRF